MKALCFGSMNIDYVYSLDHIVAPGETIFSTGREIFAGGKGLPEVRTSFASERPQALGCLS